MNKINKSSVATLRQKAEELLKRKPSSSNSQLFEADILKLVHENEVYQIELELQNEELKVANERAAKAAEEKYAELYDFSPSGYITLSKEGLINELNLRAANMLCKERSDLKNDSFVFFVTDDTKPIFNLFIEKAFKSNVNETCEVSLSTGDKLTIYVHLAGIISQNREQLYLTLTDVTELKKAEELLQKSEHRLKDILYSLADWIWEVDEKGVYTYSSQKGFELFGSSNSDVIGKTPFDFMPADEAERVAPIFAEIVKKQAPIKDLENWNITNNGKRICLLTNGVPIFDAAGTFKGYRGVDKDITERKKGEEDLLNSYARLITLLQTIPDMIWLKDTNGRYLLCNKIFERFFGSCETDIIGKTDYDFVDSELAELFRENDQKAMEANKPTINEEWVTFANDGHRALLETIKAPMYDSKNKLIGVLGIGRDVTERKKAEVELKERNIFIQTVLDNLPIGIALNNIDSGEAFYENKKFEEIYGWSKDDIKDISGFFEKVYPDKAYREELFARINADVKSGDVSRMHWEDITVTIKDGTTHIVNAVNIPLFEQNTMVSTVFDVTERKQAEEEITMLAQSLKSVSECLSITDLEDKILFVNESFLKTYGYEQNELIGKQIAIVQSQGNDQEMVKEILPATINGEWHGELFNRRKDGTEFPVFLSTSIIKDKNNKTLGLIGVATDITERNRAEQELINAKEKAEESDRLKSAFLANMSHEIRTPMNGILGFSELLKEPNLSGEEQQEYIQIIQKSGARMLGIINDIVSISKIESGQIELSVKETNINEQIDFLQIFFKPEAEQKQIQLISRKTLTNKDAVLKTDKEKLYAVLTNLIKNAIKFTNAGVIEFGYEKKDNCIEFFVKDTGSGVLNNQKEFIFERFRQGSESLNRNYEGAGLGLSISKAYVEILGGKIWIESEDGKGSIFYFTLPYFKIPEETKVVENFIPVEKSDNQHIKLKILIAEDDEISQKLIASTVKKYSEKILLVSNGFEAVEACRNNLDFDLVLMDIKMPIMDGYEAIRQIRQFNSDVVIFAQTAYALTGDREKAINCGCNDYITKPIKKEKLLELLQKYFKN